MNNSKLWAHSLILSTARHRQDVPGDLFEKLPVQVFMRESIQIDNAVSAVHKDLAEAILHGKKSAPDGEPHMMAGFVQMMGREPHFDDIGWQLVFGARLIDQAGTPREGFSYVAYACLVPPRRLWGKIKEEL
jgi:hypothetical protein